MKRLNIYIIVSCICFSLAAQDKIQVLSFKELNDQTARLDATKVYDQNNELCALIKVETDQKGFIFDVGMLGVTKVDESHAREVWVYVPHDVRRITIQHELLGTLRDYYFPIRVEAGHTYLLKLVTDKVIPYVVEGVRNQYLVFDVRPKGALLELNGEKIELTTGHAERYLPFGTYNYRITLPKYHVEAGQAEVNDASQKTHIKIKLMPAYGFLKLEGKYIEGGSVYIDGEKKGTAPLQIDTIPSGKHHMTIIKEGYKTLEQEIEIRDDYLLTLAPVMGVNTSEVTFRVAGNAQIWIDGEYRGDGQVSGTFEAGKPIVLECKKEGYQTSTCTKTLNPNLKDVSIQLPPPTPIFGTLKIETTPTGAKVLISGKEAGITPLQLTNVRIGDRDITIQKDGYITESRTVKISQFTPAELIITLKPEE